MGNGTPVNSSIAHVKKPCLLPRPDEALGFRCAQLTGELEGAHVGWVERKSIKNYTQKPDF